MHPALRLEEILLNIFGQCYPHIPKSGARGSSATADLAALARTCRTFKEPALDVLWTELVNLSPLAQCLPDASRKIYTEHTWYSFSRPLEKDDWDIIRGYARRVRSILEFTRGLDWDSVKTLFNPPTSDPVFPNLRNLHWDFIGQTFPLMRHLAVSSLTSLEVNFVFGDIPPFDSFPQSLGDLCPNIRRFRIRMHRPQARSNEAVSAVVRCWTNLKALHCQHISFDIDTLLHLSSTPSLTHLSFTLSAAVANQIASSNPTLIFPRLCNLEVSSQALESISALLSHVRLPAIGSLFVHIDSCPSMLALKSHLTIVRRNCNHHTFSSLRVVQARSLNPTNHDLDRPQLTLEDIEPCMAFDHLRCIDINIASTVKLSDDDLLHLTSAWPRLECLSINEGSGWKTKDGITPSGLVHLLQRLESLRYLCLAIDTRYTEIPAALDSLQDAEFSLRTPFFVNVADSAIRPELIDALAIFFGAVMQRYTNPSSYIWTASSLGTCTDSEVSRKLWEDVFFRAYGRAGAKFQNLPLTLTASAPSLRS